MVLISRRGASAWNAAVLLLGVAACSGPGGTVGATPDAGMDDARSGRDAALDGGPLGRGRECRFDTQCDDGAPGNGRERCFEGRCRPAVFADDGTRCERDGLPNTPDVCLGGVCVASLCGDGVLDARAEQCDDGNGVASDGCFHCRHLCVEDDDCDDGRECNGAERCELRTHTCLSRPALDEGAPCAEEAGACAEGVCLLLACDDEESCSDGDPCNGIETCDGACHLGAPIACDDSDPCTADLCVPGVGCDFPLIDADGDGYAPASLGACGTDCDDRHPDVHPGAPELCDLRDNDCDRVVDEDTELTWYVDCDGDGFAVRDARRMISCRVPSGGLTGCPGPGHWTAASPTSRATVDCNDVHPLVHPAQTVFQAAPIPGAPPERDFDYDCDGLETPIFSEGLARCEPLGESPECLVTPGWLGEVPPCGGLGLMLASCRAFIRSSGAVECAQIPSATFRTQRCR